MDTDKTKHRFALPQSAIHNPNSGASAFGQRHLRRASWLIFALWTLAVAASVFWNARLLHDAMVEAAATDARSNFNKDVLYRRWATLHGGVYVPVTTNTPPNPYLTNVTERDLVTPSGRRLTLVNPAYITRQVHELEHREDGSHGHITSLKPLRPENAPDAWEANALKSFEKGQTEQVACELFHGKPHLRLMRPLVAEKACLMCHAAQGYREGEIRGGISVAVSLAPYLAMEQARIGPIVGAHAALWALGVLGIFLGGRQMRQRLARQMEAEAQLRENEEKFRTVADWTYDLETWRTPDGRYLYVSPSAERITGYRAEEFLADPELMLKIIHAEDRAKVVEHYQKTTQPTQDVSSLDFRIVTRSGEERWISHHCQSVYGDDGRWLGQRSSNRDITLRKQADGEVRHQATFARFNPNPVLEFIATGEISYFNDAAVEMAQTLGLAKPEQILPPDTAAIIRDCLATNQPKLRVEITIASRVISWSFFPIAPSRTVHGYAGDVTSRKQAEAEREQLIQELQKALANVKSLSGLLPICSGCKKIRDDKGYWSQVESYVAKHSEAKFTHGMCPDCVKKYFPEIGDLEGEGK
ncbi:MAG: DUF3365 domain-containing protein [Verrucomicrobiota bacterium]